MHIFILLLFVLSRLAFINHLPIFIDEALYVRWVDTIVSSGFTQLFVSLKEDGQPPLFFILAAGIKSLFHCDTLLLIRILAVLFGGLTLWYGMRLVKSFTKNNQSSYSFTLLYITSPFILMYDRLGMRDSAISWALVATLLYLHQKKWLKAGVCMAIGIAIKSTAWFIPLLAVLFLMFTKTKVTTKELLRWILPAMGVIGVFLLTQTFHQAVAKNTIFITTPAEFGHQLRNNTYQTGIWMWQYLSPTVCLGFVAAMLHSCFRREHRFQQIQFCLLACVPMIISIGIAKIYFPRYILLSAILFLVYMAITVRKTLIVGVLCIVPAVWSFSLITHPTTAPLPQIEKWQYISGWPAGYGVKETASFLVQYQPDLILTESTDLLRTGLPYYQPILASKITPVSDSYLTASYLSTHRVVLALHLNKTIPSAYNGVKLFEYQKPNQGDTLVIFGISGVQQ